MTNDEYTRTQAELTELGKFILLIDLPGFLSRIDGASTVAPIVDPTLWSKGHRKLEQVRELAQAANELRSVVIRQLELEGVDGQNLLADNGHRSVPSV
jgi:hypothetical protein